MSRSVSIPFRSVFSDWRKKIGPLTDTVYKKNPENSVQVRYQGHFSRQRAPSHELALMTVRI